MAVAVPGVFLAIKGASSPAFLSTFFQKNLSDDPPEALGTELLRARGWRAPDTWETLMHRPPEPILAG